MSGLVKPLELRKILKPQLPRMLKTLRKFVEAESPSTDRIPCDHCAEIISATWSRQCTDVAILSQRNRGAHIRIVWRPPTSRPMGQLLVLGHYDTVYAAGTLAEMPFRLSGGKAFGPGVFDMKAGIVQALFALDALRRMRAEPRKRIVFLWTSDEEIGSESSRTMIEAEARRSDAVFVVEPAFGPKGLIKTARKGVGEAELIVRGRASHAGLAPQEGVNAIHELAQLIIRIARWNDSVAGVTVNADVIEGGTRVNVIAESARASLDLRAMKVADMRKMERRLRSLRPSQPGTKLEIRGGFNRPPMERRYSAKLYMRAKFFAAQMGLILGECAVGGGSDGNFTAALGIPTLDGLGAVGYGAHSANEYILADEMPTRSALLASLLLES